MEDGTYIVKDGTVYKITSKIKLPYGKRVNVQTGEVYYPTNADLIRSMTDEELVKHLACQWKECKNMDVDCDKCLLGWLRQETYDEN